MSEIPPTSKIRSTSETPSQLPATLQQLATSQQRVVMRTQAGVNEHTGRMSYRDYVGTVQRVSLQGRSVEFRREAAANGTRPASLEHIDIASIVVIKTMPSLDAKRPPRGKSPINAQLR